MALSRDFKQALQAGIDAQLAQDAFKRSIQASLQLSVQRANVIAPQDPALIKRLLAEIEANFSGLLDPRQFPAGRGPGAPRSVRDVMAMINRRLSAHGIHGHPNPFTEATGGSSTRGHPNPFAGAGRKTPRRSTR